MYPLYYTSIFAVASAAVINTLQYPLASTVVDDSCKVGAEFESPYLRFENAECSSDDTFKAKGKAILGHTGSSRKLTGDTGVDQGKLNAEYILDGTSIKVGSGNARKAGADAATDLVSASKIKSHSPALIPIR